MHGLPGKESDCVHRWSVAPWTWHSVAQTAQSVRIHEERRELGHRRHCQVQAVSTQPRRPNRRVFLDHPRYDNLSSQSPYGRVDRILIGEYPHGVAFPDKKRKATERVASRTDALTCILLEQIGTFVSLMASDELRTFEAALDPPVLPAETPDGPFGYETQLLERHAKLTAERDRAVAAAQKYVTSAAKSLQQVATSICANAQSYTMIRPSETRVLRISCGICSLRKSRPPTQT